MVLLIGHYAIKLPNLRYRYPSCLYGILHNFTERNWWLAACGEFGDGELGMRKLLCPVVWASRFGIVIIMRRVEPLPRTYDCPVFFNWLASRFERAGCSCPAELKSDSFGILDGEFVAVDYA